MYAIRSYYGEELRRGRGERIPAQGADGDPVRVGRAAPYGRQADEQDVPAGDEQLVEPVPDALRQQERPARHRLRNNFV